jgi:hypothetical protein
MKELRDFEISEFGKPSTPGIYAIWSRNHTYESGINHLLYIGSTNNIHSRLSGSSHPYRIAFNRINGIVWTSFIEISNPKDNEKYLISKHKPILNKQWR